MRRLTLGCRCDSPTCERELEVVEVSKGVYKVRVLTPGNGTRTVTDYYGGDKLVNLAGDYDILDVRDVIDDDLSAEFHLDQDVAARLIAFIEEGRRELSI
jgi:hypothetical protein